MTLHYTVARNGEALLSYYRGIALASFRRRARRLAAIRTVKDLHVYQAEIAVKLRRCFGDFPERTPLNPRTVGSFRKHGFLYEKLLIESRPGLLESMLLCKREDVAGPLPAVLLLSGHDINGKAYPVYQELAQRLAHRGFAVLANDPISQGDRMLFPGQRKILHSEFGETLSLRGGYLGNWFVWDNLRALEYLEGRPDIDPARICVTGNSGGGTQTYMLAAFAPKLAAVAPNCSLSRASGNVANQVFADAEQMVPGLFAEDLDFADFLVARVPKPTLILGEEKDFFDRRAVQEIHQELLRLYRLCGKEDQLDLRIGPGGHAYSKHAQEYAASAFARIVGLPEAPESAFQPQPLTPEDLCCERRDNCRNIYDLLPTVSPDRSIPLKKRIEQCLKIGRIGKPPYWILRPMNLPGGVSFDRFGIDSEPGIVPVLKKRVPTPSPLQIHPEGRVTLYLPDQDSIAEADCTELPAECFFLDHRACGENRPNEIYPGCRPALEDEAVETGLSGVSVLCGRPQLGGIVRDILATVAVMRREGMTGLSIVALGRGAVQALIAGIFIPELTHLTLWDEMPYWEEYGREVSPPFSNIAAVGLLNHFSTEELFAALRRRGVALTQCGCRKRYPLSARPG